MRISRIKVENHRSIPELNVEVNDHLVIIGPNESGKTRLLELLNSVLTKSKSQLTYELNSYNPIRDITKPLVVEVVLTDLTPAEIAVIGKFQEPVKDDTQQLGLHLRMVVSEKVGKISYERKFTKPGLGGQLDSDDVPDSMEAEIPGIDFDSLTEEQRSIIKWAYLSSDRQPDKILGQSRRSVVQNLLRKIALGDAKPEIEAALSLLYDEIKGHKSTEELREKVASEFGKLFSREISKNDISINLSTLDETNLLGNFGINLQDSSSSTAFANSLSRPLRHQSDGIKSMATVVIQLLEFELEDNSILAIDEPEIHLHPKAQVRFAKWLTETKGQRIITTHSSAVLEVFSPKDVIALNPAGKCKQLPESTLNKDRKLLLHRWNSFALEPLTSRLILLVEGPTDHLLLESFARALGCDFNQLDVSVVQTGGVGSFPAFIRFFGEDGFGIPLLGLLDKDKYTVSNHAKEVAECLDISEDLTAEDIEEEMKQQGFWLANLNLEDECVNTLGVSKHADYLFQSGVFSDSTQYYLRRCIESDPDISIKKYRDWCKDDKRKPYIAIGLERAIRLQDPVEVKSALENFTLVKEIAETVKAKVNEN